jgi:hypothetical protein
VKCTCGVACAASGTSACLQIARAAAAARMVACPSLCIGQASLCYTNVKVKPTKRAPTTIFCTVSAGFIHTVVLGSTQLVQASQSGLGARSEVQLLLHYLPDRQRRRCLRAFDTGSAGIGHACPCGCACGAAALNSSPLLQSVLPAALAAGGPLPATAGICTAIRPRRRLRPLPQLQRRRCAA